MSAPAETPRFPWSGLRLFRVSLEGQVTYYVVGSEGTPAEMQAGIEAQEGATFAEEGWPDLTPDDIREVPEAEARTTVCRGDGEPDTDMWTAAAETRAAGCSPVVTCSEWP